MLVLLFTCSGLYSQDSDEQTQGNIFVLSTVKVPSNNIEQLLDQWETYTKTIVMQNEYILSAKVFTRMYGPDWTVATLLEYASLADMEKDQQRSDGLARAIYPDEEERTERTKLIQSLMVGHTSTIIRDVPVLTK